MVSLRSLEKIKNKLKKEFPGAEGKFDKIFILTKLVFLKIKKGELTEGDINDLPLPSSYKSVLAKVVKTKDPAVAKKVANKFRLKIFDNLEELKSKAGGNVLVNWKIRKVEKQVNRLSRNVAGAVSVSRSISTLFIIVSIAWILSITLEVAQYGVPESTRGILFLIFAYLIGLMVLARGLVDAKEE